jgi:hypothetical protein
MTQIEKALNTGRRVARDARKAGAHAISSGEMLQASGDVIAARLEIMRAGLADPGKADLREISLMSSEKIEALSVSAAATARNLGDLGDRLSQAARNEAERATRAASAMATASTPAAAASIQMTYAMGWWSRTASQMLSINTAMLKTQADALKPIHSAAVANARRLKKA